MKPVLVMFFALCVALLAGFPTAAQAEEGPLSCEELLEKIQNLKYHIQRFEGLNEDRQEEIKEKGKELRGKYKDLDNAEKLGKKLIADLEKAEANLKKEQDRGLKRNPAKIIRLQQEIEELESLIKATVGLIEMLRVDVETLEKAIVELWTIIIETNRAIAILEIELQRLTDLYNENPCRGEIPDSH